MALDSTLDATVQALQSGPKKIPVPAAIQNINTWETELASVPAAKSIVSDLGQLRTLLESGSPDDAKISTLLQKLSSDTTASASGAGPDLAPKLQQLGKLLAHGV